MKRNEPGCLEYAVIIPLYSGCVLIVAIVGGVLYTISMLIAALLDDLVDFAKGRR